MCTHLSVYFSKSRGWEKEKERWRFLHWTGKRDDVSNTWSTNIFALSKKTSLNIICLLLVYLEVSAITNNYLTSWSIVQEKAIDFVACKSCWCDMNNLKECLDVPEWIYIYIVINFRWWSNRRWTIVRSRVMIWLVLPLAFLVNVFVVQRIYVWASDEMMTWHDKLHSIYTND